MQPRETFIEFFGDRLSLSGLRALLEWRVRVLRIQQVAQSIKIALERVPGFFTAVLGGLFSINSAQSMFQDET